MTFDVQFSKLSEHAQINNHYYVSSTARFYFYMYVCMFYYSLFEDQETEAQKVKSYIEESGFKLMSP